MYAKAELAVQSYDQSWKKPVAKTINTNKNFNVIQWKYIKDKYKKKIFQYLKYMLKTKTYHIEGLQYSTMFARLANREHFGLNLLCGS